MVHRLFLGGSLKCVAGKAHWCWEEFPVGPIQAAATACEHHLMDETVAKLNIEHFKKSLASETDATKRELITRLLGEEEAKLAKILKERKQQT
jgi:hypothetical protein